MKTSITHIQVLDTKGHPDMEAEQMLQIVRETPSFYWVRSFSGTNYQVSKKTKKIIGTIGTFLRESKKPMMNL